MAHVDGLVSAPALDENEETPAPFTEYEEPELGGISQPGQRAHFPGCQPYLCSCISLRVYSQDCY